MPKLDLSHKKGKGLRNPLCHIRISTDITNPLFVDGTNAVSVTTGDTFGKIGLHLLDRWGGSSAPAAIKAPFGRFSSALRTENGNQRLITMGTLHLFLLYMKTLDETIDISFVSPQFVKEFLRTVIRE